MATQTSFQERLAFWVVVIGSIVAGVCAITAIVATAIGSADGKSQTATAAKDILSITLPVLGTWIGTVLAFYFGKENYKAAAEETRLTLGQRLSRLALEVAIPAAKIKSFPVADLADAHSATLDRVSHELDGIKPYDRLPFMTPDGRVLYVLHRQPLDSFLRVHRETSAAALTFDQLLKSEYGQRVRDALVFVSRTATLADAKAGMEARAHCKDVFVTQNGRPTEPVIGWVTNNAIQQAAHA